jgi:hypothetical protein
MKGIITGQQLQLSSPGGGRTVVVGGGGGVMKSGPHVGQSIGQSLLIKNNFLTSISFYFTNKIIITVFEVVVAICGKEENIF